MAYDFKSEEDVKLFLHNLGIEYRFGCYSEKNPEVCHLLADYLEAVKKDYDKARKVYKSNCDDHNFGRSCMKYGTYALLGKGGMKEDYKSGYEYLKKGCDQNVADACFHQGLMLISNYDKCQVAPDAKRGLSLLQKACDAKNANACYYASGFYISGIKKDKSEGEQSKDGKPEYILPKNMSEAHKYALQGCDLGNVYCCVNLSQMYKKGDGVAKDEELAAKYKKIALDMQSDIQSNQTLNFQQGLS